MVTYYLSDHVLGYGQFVVVITAQHLDLTDDHTTETCVFGLDSEGIFKRKCLVYTNRKKGDAIGFDFTQQYALRKARQIIYDYQRDKYRETKDSDYLKSKIDFHDCEKHVMITLKYSGYKHDLEQLAKDTLSPELREYLNFILSLNISIMEV